MNMNLWVLWVSRLARSKSHFQDLCEVFIWSFMRMNLWVLWVSSKSECRWYDLHEFYFKRNCEVLLWVCKKFLFMFHYSCMMFLWSSMNFVYEALWCYCGHLMIFTCSFNFLGLLGVVPMVAAWPNTHLNLF